MNKRFICMAISAFLLVSVTACTGGTRSKSGGGTGYTGESLNDQVARHEQQLQTILSQVGQVEQVLPGQAEMWSQVQTMRQDLNGVHGKVEDLQNQVSGSGSGEMARLNERIARLEALVRKMASQLAISADSLDAPSAVPTSGGSGAAPYSSTDTAVVPDASGGVVIVNGEPETAGVTGTAGAAGAAPTVDTATALYDGGIKSFDQRKYKEAIVSFKDFGSLYPKHKLASNAFFWQGESYYQLKDYPRAVLAYQEVIAKYPGSSKMQSAMLKQGISLHNAGKKDAAVERLQELIKKYPSSPEATRAKQFIQTKK